MGCASEKTEGTPPFGIGTEYFSVNRVKFEGRVGWALGGIGGVKRYIYPSRAQARAEIEIIVIHSSVATDWFNYRGTGRTQNSGQPISP